MIKYVPSMTNVVLEEIPGKVTLAVEISNCRGHCEGCHSPWLKEDVGEELTEVALDALFAGNYGVNCFLFLGEGRDSERLMALARYVRSRYPVELALYSGRSEVEEAFYEVCDYVKVGPYVKALGPLNNPATNQRLYYHHADITSRFWHRGLDTLRKP